MTYEDQSTSSVVKFWIRDRCLSFLLSNGKTITLNYGQTKDLILACGPALLAGKPITMSIPEEYLKDPN